MTVTVKQTQRGVYLFRYTIKPKAGDKIKILNISDVHLDSEKCDRDLLKSHCEKADFIKIYGDLFDLMQGKHDRRRSYSDLKDKHKAINYIDLVVMDAVEFFAPFAKKLIFVSLGNHESSVVANTGTNPLSVFSSRLRLEHGSNVVEGSYQGFIIDSFFQQNTQKKIIGSYITAYHHGHGGAPQKTEGTLEIEGDKAKYPNADIIVKGHNHFRWHNPGQTRYWLNTSYFVEERVQHHVRLGTYKRPEFTDGWSVEKGFKPTSVGGYFFNYELYAKNSKGYKMNLEIVPT